MVQQNWELIEHAKETKQEAITIRTALSELRKEIKKGNAAEELEQLLSQEKENILMELLESEDAKTRKNTALLVGDLGRQSFLDALFTTYEKEEQLFIKSSYLTAMSKMDYRAYLSPLKDRFSNLQKEPLTLENKKHIEEEMRVLTEMIVLVDGIKPHKFTGEQQLSELILLTNRDHKQATANQIEKDSVQEFNAGLKLTTNRLFDIFPIRTYQELLFVVKGMKVLEKDAEKIAVQVAKSDLLYFLEKRHAGETPFYFRLECKSKMPLDKKSAFVKQIATQLERLTDRRLVNSTTNYEFEIRLIETKEGKFNALVKLHTIPDTRFAYRKESIAVSIKPVNAALMVQLAKEYMIPDARVLDPFCGVGTMLIERQMIVKANTSYGIDILNDAIEKAKINTESAGQIIHYINKDFFDFKHEYLFDEIFTNMPFAIGRKTETEIEELYRQFFDCARTHLEKEGTLILFSHNKELVKRLAKEKKYRILKLLDINQKEGTSLIILQA